MYCMDPKDADSQYFKMFGPQVHNSFGTGICRPLISSTSKVPNYRVCRNREYGFG